LARAARWRPDAAGTGDVNALNLDQLLAEISVAENTAAVAAAIMRHVDAAAAGLPAHKREQLNEKIQDVIRERRERGES
jgi:hypothetical protein